MPLKISSDYLCCWTWFYSSEELWAAPSFSHLIIKIKKKPKCIVNIMFVKVGNKDLESRSSFWINYTDSLEISKNFMRGPYNFPNYFYMLYTLIFWIYIIRSWKWSQTILFFMYLQDWQSSQSHWSSNLTLPNCEKHPILKIDHKKLYI